MDLAHIAPLERRRHRLEEILDTTANTFLKCPLQFAHVDVQADLCAVPRVACLL